MPSQKTVVEKVKVLGRMRNITLVGRTRMIVFKGEQIALSKAYIMEKKQKKEAKNKITEKNVGNTMKQVHPDTHISKEAKVYIIKYEPKSAKELDNILSIAGDIARYDREKKTVILSDVKIAMSIIEAGTTSIRKEKARLRAKRRVFVQKLHKQVLKTKLK